MRSHRGPQVLLALRIKNNLRERKLLRPQGCSEERRLGEGRGGQNELEGARRREKGGAREGETKRRGETWRSYRWQ